MDVPIQAGRALSIPAGSDEKTSVALFRKQTNENVSFKRERGGATVQHLLSLSNTNEGDEHLVFYSESPVE